MSSLNSSSPICQTNSRIIQSQTDSMSYAVSGNKLPVEIWQKIISFCDYKTLCTCTQVCKNWNANTVNYVYQNHKAALYVIKRNPSHLKNVSENLLTDRAFLSDLMEQRPDILGCVPEALKANKDFMMSLVNIFAFGKDDWEKYFGSIGEVPALPNDIVDILCADDLYSVDVPRKKVFETQMLVLIPKTVNSDNLTINTCIDLFKTTLDIKNKNSNLIQGVIRRHHGTKTCKDTQWVLIRKEPIPFSQSKSYEKQKELFTKNSQYEIPDLLSVLIGLLTHYVRKRQYLLQTPFLYTFCSETFFLSEVQVHAIVGNFTESGVDFSGLQYSCSSPMVGTIVLLKLHP